MSTMSIEEAAKYFSISKEAIHNRIRRGSLVSSIVDGVKMVDVDKNTKKTPLKKTPVSRKSTTPKVDDRYYKLLEEQNTQLQTKVEKLENETKSLREQKELMLIQERIKIEQIYKDKDEQLKNILTTLSSQLMLNAPLEASEIKKAEHVEAEIEVQEEVVGELISLKKYLKSLDISEKKKEKIKARFHKKAKKDNRIIIFGSKYYIDVIKFDYSDLIKNK